MPTDDPELNTKIALLLAGGFIGLVSGLVTTALAHYLTNKRIKRLQEREDQLRLKERDREDKLRREELTRDRQSYIDQLGRDNRLRLIEMLARDCDRLIEQLEKVPETAVDTQLKLERRLDAIRRERQRLMQMEGFYKDFDPYSID